MDAEPYIPPHNAEIEAALLGAILTNNLAYDKVALMLRQEFFYEPVHGRIYAAIEALINSSQAATPLTLKQYFDNDEALEAVGGGQYLFDLAAAIVTIVNAEDYARTIRDLYQRRRLIEISHDTINRAADPHVELPTTDIIAGAEEDLYELGFVGRAPELRSMGDVTNSALANVEAAVKARNRGEMVGIPTGLTELDRKLGGLRDGYFYIIAGATSQGKSALAGTIADTATKAGHYVLFGSLEMSGEQLVNRSLSRESGLSLSNIERGDLDDRDLAALFELQPSMYERPLQVVDTGGLSLTDLRSLARRAKVRGKLHMIIVDYLQLMDPPTGQRFDGRAREVAAITRGLKILARELQVPVVALSQLSRAVDHRDDHRPKLSDLRESGAIEQDADVVIFVYREEFYLRNEKPPESDEHKTANWETAVARSRGLAELNVAKQRQGALGIASVAYREKQTLFCDKDEPEAVRDRYEPAEQDPLI